MPTIGPLEERYATEAVRSSWVSSTGPFVDRFEADFAEYTGTRAAVAVVNGTAAVHLALVALGVGPGDEVILPSLTYVATANAVRYTGATPVFVDVDPRTWCLDPPLVEEVITDRTRGVIAVHLYGHPADMDRLASIARRHDLWVVEDAAESHGARYRGARTGGLARVGAFSFYGNKVITSGEGGALTLSDPGLEARIRLFRGQGMDPERRYWFPEVGFNYRMTNVAAAIACAQLERIDEILADRRASFRGYAERLVGIPGIAFQPVESWAEPAPWLFCITVDAAAFGTTRDTLASELEAVGIETRPFFVPLHQLPAYRDLPTPELPQTARLAETGLNLPTFVGLASSDLDRVADAIRRVQRSGGKRARN
jgi:perosamine synthetase